MGMRDRLELCGRSRPPSNADGSAFEPFAWNEPAGGTLTMLRLLRAEEIKRPRLELPTSSWFRDSSRPPGR